MVVNICTGDNFFKSVSYTIEVLCAASFVEEKESLREVEAQILTKRAELPKFEVEYKEVYYITMHVPCFFFTRTYNFPCRTGPCTIHTND